MLAVTDEAREEVDFVAFLNEMQVARRAVRRDGDEWDLAGVRAFLA